MRRVSKKLHRAHGEPSMRYVALAVVFAVIGNLLAQTFLSSSADPES